jgi:HAD superfamily hydrolase (TIGR01509 family)
MTAGYGVLWDMDGVLADTGDFHFHAWVQTLQTLGIPFTPELFRTTFGMNNTGILTTLLGEAPTPAFVAKVSERKEALFREAIRGRARLLPGARNWLARLERDGFLQAVASSAPLANIEALVGELGLRPCFVALVSGFDLPGKPDPALFLGAARLIGVPPDGCVVVEDAVVGVEAARRAGMKCVAVATTNPLRALQGADVAVERLDALPPDTFERLFGLLL